RHIVDADALRKFVVDVFPAVAVVVRVDRVRQTVAVEIVGDGGAPEHALRAGEYSTTTRDPRTAREADAEVRLVDRAVPVVVGPVADLEHARVAAREPLVGIGHAAPAPR